MTIRADYLAKTLGGSPGMAAARLALDLATEDPNDPYRDPYTHANAVLAAVEIFPEVRAEAINRLNGWSTPDTGGTV